ncbi:hypothetical protein CFP56_017191 [Quercus suber]|uniref:Reverse transcriptase zinc-binding domain-containing protein n=1 Tax=Quercus suber TaxID=58331 RepID=A0AAW0KMU3_QUESU
MCYKLVKISSTDVCTFSGCPYETALHIFIKCPFTIYVWANLLLPIELENLLVSSIKSLIIGLRCPAEFFKLEVEEAGFRAGPNYQSKRSFQDCWKAWLPSEASEALRKWHPPPALQVG